MHSEAKEVNKKVVLKSQHSDYITINNYLNLSMSGRHLLHSHGARYGDMSRRLRFLPRRLAEPRLRLPMTKCYRAAESTRLSELGPEPDAVQPYVMRQRGCGVEHRSVTGAGFPAVQGPDPGALERGSFHVERRSFVDRLRVAHVFPALPALPSVSGE